MMRWGQQVHFTSNEDRATMAGQTVTPAGVSDASTYAMTLSLGKPSKKIACQWFTQAKIGDILR